MDFLSSKELTRLSLYFIFAALSTVGNSFLCYVIFKQKRRSSTFLLIASQSVSDITYGFTQMLGFVVCHKKFVDLGRAALFICELTTYNIGVACYIISSFTMMAIAFERFVRLYFPFAAKVTVRQTFGAIVAIWTFGLFLAFIGMVNSINIIFSGNDDSKPQCFLMYKELSHFDFFQKNVGYWIFAITAAYVPMVITSTFCALVVHKIRTQRVGVVGSVTLDKEKQLNLKRMRTIKMLITMLLAYYGLVFPISIFSGYITYQTGEHNLCYSIELFSLPILGLALALFSTCVNPLILCYYIPSFREEARRLFRCDSRKDDPVVANQSNTFEESQQSTTF